MAQFTFPGAHLTVHCACGASMSLRHVARDLQRHTEEHEYVCSSCGYHHIVQLPSVTFHNGPIWTPTEPEKPKDPEPEPEPPVINGGVVGYRAWRILDWALAGTFSTVPWVPGVNEARCASGALSTAWDRDHPAPALGCHCGITALARFKEQDSHWVNADVFGAIEAWSDETVDTARPDDGYISEATANVLASRPVPLPKPREPGRFILHGTGFRAQYGKVVLLAVDDDWPAAKKAAVRALAREHEADVCKHAHLEDAAKEHGQLVPDDMLAWAKEGDPEAGAFSPGYFIPPAWNTFFPQYFAGGLPQFQIYSHTTSGFVGGSPKRAKGPRPTGKPGICQTLGYNGPPTHDKYRKNQRVRDRAGATWRCVRGGQPGTWERET